MSKPKTASIEFDKATFPTEAACVAWLESHGRDASACTPLPASFVFKQADGIPNAGKKSLGTGVTALLTKAFGKDDDEEKKKKKPEEKSEDKPDDKPTKPVEDDEDDESDDMEAGDEEDSEDGDEGEEPEEGEDSATDEEADPEALKAESEFILNHIAHFGVQLDHIKAEGKSVKKYASLLAEMTKACEEMRDKWKAAHLEGFAEHMVDQAVDELKTGASAADEDMPADDEPADTGYDDDMRKSLASLREEAEESRDVAKSLVA